MILYRPTGRKELELVKASGWRRWPPRLPDQPLFYPVTSFDYAEKIARDWNSKGAAPDNEGFVTRFEIAAGMAARYPVRQAGGRAQDELEAFCDGIVGLTQAAASYRSGQRVG